MSRTITEEPPFIFEGILEGRESTENNEGYQDDTEDDLKSEVIRGNAQPGTGDTPYGSGPAAPMQRGVAAGSSGRAPLLWWELGA